MRIRVLIEGNDLTEWVSNYDWNIQTSDMDDIDVLTMEFEDEYIIGVVHDNINNRAVFREGYLDIRRGYDVIIEDYFDDTIRYFGGIIAEKTTRPDGLGNITSIIAQDWKVLLDKSSFTAKYSGMDDRDIITDAFLKSNVNEIDTSGVLLVRKKLEYMEFAGHSLRSMMVTVSEIANAKWYLDPFKRLFYGKTHDSPAPFNLNSDSPNHVTTFPFYDSEYVEELGNYNEVELRGPQTLSDNITETFSGDGTRTVWRLGVFLNSSGTISEPLNVEPDRPFIDAIDPSLPSRIVIEKNTGTDC